VRFAPIALARHVRVSAYALRKAAVHLALSPSPIFALARPGRIRSRRRMTFPACQKIGARWDLGEDGTLCLAKASRSLARDALSIWESRCEPRLVDWRWALLVGEYPEAFALLAENGHARALWCSRSRRTLRLPVGPTYELGYIEVDPDDRGGTVGYVTLAIVACRALEVGAVGMVLAFLPYPGLERFYENAGGQKGKVKGWQAPRGLAPYFFPREALLALQETAHGCERV